MAAEATELVIDTIMQMPDGKYHARLLEDGEWVWRENPDDLAKKVIAELDEAMRHLAEEVERGRSLHPEDYVD